MSAAHNRAISDFLNSMDELVQFIDESQHREEHKNDTSKMDSLYDSAVEKYNALSALPKDTNFPSRDILHRVTVIQTLLNSIKSEQFRRYDKQKWDRFLENVQKVLDDARLVLVDIYRDVLSESDGDVENGEDVDNDDSDSGDDSDDDEISSKKRKLIGEVMAYVITGILTVTSASVATKIYKDYKQKKYEEEQRQTTIEKYARYVSNSIRTKEDFIRVVTAFIDHVTKNIPHISRQQKMRLAIVIATLAGLGVLIHRLKLYYRSRQQSVRKSSSRKRSSRKSPSVRKSSSRKRKSSVRK